MPSQEQQDIMLLKGLISRLEARLEFVFEHLGVSFVEDTRTTDDPAVVAALKANNLPEALKAYRAATNASLKEARSGVEEMRMRLGI